MREASSTSRRRLMRLAAAGDEESLGCQPWQRRRMARDADFAPLYATLHGLARTLRHEVHAIRNDAVDLGLITH